MVTEKKQPPTKYPNNTTKSNFCIILGISKQTKPGFTRTKGVVVQCLINPWLYFKLFPLQTSQCKFPYFRCRQNSWGSFALSRHSAHLPSRTEPAGTSYHENLYFCDTPMRTGKQFSKEGTRTQWKVMLKGVLYLCTKNTLGLTCLMLPPAMLPAWFPPPALPITLRQVVSSTLNI